MRKILIDTNVYVSFKRRDENIGTELKQVDYIGIEVTVLAELYAGFKFGNREKENRKNIEAFIDTPRVEILKHDLITAEYYSKIYLDLRKNGTPIPTNDIWIAAVAMQHGLALFTLDKHFNSVDGLIVKSE